MNLQMETLSFLNSIKLYIPLFLLIVFLIHKIKTNEIKIKWLKFGILSIITIFLSISSYSTIATYNLWKTDPFSKFLLPPYEEAYFYGYAFSHFWQSFFVIILVSVSWAIFLHLARKRTQNRILDKDEVYLGFFTALSVGFPAFIPYLFILFFIFSIQQIINIIILKKTDPIIITHSMILSAIIVLLYGNKIINQFGLGVLKV
ncbi:MAG: hypothetical protein P1P85_02040 [Patescibacteria group bacterium]|nr:hypothetical protein [Patescibacteria group bacterium]